jgi:lipoprotein NlpI
LGLRALSVSGHSPIAGMSVAHSQPFRNKELTVLRFILSLIALLMVGAISPAHSNDHAANCAAEAGPEALDLAIDGCSLVIDSGELSDRDLAIAFANRGLAYFNKRDYDRAIQDFDQAIRFDPDATDYFYRRGLAYFEKNDYDRAIENFNEALKLGPENVSILRQRGSAFEAKKEYDHAIRDYDRAISLQSNYGPALLRRAHVYQEKRQYEQALADYEAAAQADPKSASERSKGFLFFYLGWMTQSAEAFEKHMKSHPDDIWVILFRYLVEAKIGNVLAAARDLETDAAKLKERRWPAPIIDFHTGKIDEKALFAAANDADWIKKIEKICSANFHAGEARLIRGQITGAVPLLRAAAKECPSHFYESHGASTELRRLGQK